MSKERKRARDARRLAASTNWFWDTVDQIAAKEGRIFQSETEREVYVRELKQRGVIVDLGPHPSGHGQKISFRFERLPVEVQPESNSLESLFKMFGGSRERGAA
jgi:hypothetical protein